RARGGRRRRGGGAARRQDRRRPGRPPSVGRARGLASRPVGEPDRALPADPDDRVKRPRSVRDADVAGKKVLVRSDLNVPLEEGRVADDTRLRASLPTLELLLERGAADVAVCSHLGRPKGPEPAFAIAPVEARLAELLPD